MLICTCLCGDGRTIFVCILIGRIRKRQILDENSSRDRSPEKADGMRQNSEQEQQENHGKQQPPQSAAPEYRGGGESEPMENRKKHGKAKKVFQIVLAVVLILLCVVLGALYFGLRYINQRSNYVADKDVTINRDIVNATDEEGEQAIEEVSLTNRLRMSGPWLLTNRRRPTISMIFS